MNSIEIKNHFKNNLIPYYEKCIENIDDDYQNYIYLTEISNGICWCSKTIFNIDIYNEKIISNILKKVSSNTNMWFDRVSDSDSKEESIQLLQKRVNVMKAYVNKKKISKEMF